jgi:hypothetical protein
LAIALIEMRQIVGLIPVSSREVDGSTKRCVTHLETWRPKRLFTHAEREADNEYASSSILGRGRRALRDPIARRASRNA